MRKIILMLSFLLFSCSLWSQDTVVVKVTKDQKQELSYDKNNNLHGECYAWNTQGVLIGVANYKHGLKHGVWRIYYDDGTIAYEMQYKDGKKSGTWKFYNEEGKLQKELSFL